MKGEGGERVREREGEKGREGGTKCFIWDLDWSACTSNSVFFLLLLVRSSQRTSTPSLKLPM